MKTLKILRKLIKCENPEQNTTLNLSEDEMKWFKIGFSDTTSRFEVMIDLLDEEE